MRRRFFTLLCALTLAIGILLPGITASADQIAVYQTAVNDKLLTLSGENMPVLSGGSYYVPYTVFDRETTGVSLGVSCSQWKTDTAHTLTVYNQNGLLSFDINAGTCVDGYDSSRNMRAIIRNGKVYLPVGGVCTYFGLRVSYTSTPYGTLIRLTNEKAVLSTERFVDAAESLMKQRYNDYIASLTPASSSPSQSAAEHTTTGYTAPAATDTPGTRTLRIYLAFQCGSGDGGGLDAILGLLEQYNVRALFCFQTADLAACDDQIRRMVGSGHTVGLIVPSSGAAAALDEGCRLLSRIAHLRPHIVMAQGAGDVPDGLDAQGWTVWSSNLNGLSDGRSARKLSRVMLNALTAMQGAALITMDDSTVSADALRRLLPELRQQARCQFRLPAESEF